MISKELLSKLRGNSSRAEHKSSAELEAEREALEAKMAAWDAEETEILARNEKLRNAKHPLFYWELTSVPTLELIGSGLWSEYAYDCVVRRTGEKLPFYLGIEPAHPTDSDFDLSVNKQPEALRKLMREYTLQDWREQRLALCFPIAPEDPDYDPEAPGACRCGPYFDSFPELNAYVERFGIEKGFFPGVPEHDELHTDNGNPG